MSIIDNINNLLISQGKTGAELSRDLGFSNSAYSQWNTGKTKPSKKTIKIIADYFGISVEELTKESEKNTAELQFGGVSLNEALIDHLCLLSTEELAKVDAFVQGLLASR